MRSRYNILPSYRYVDVEGVRPILDKSAGKSIRDYRVYGNSVQNNSPSPDHPQAVESVGMYDETKKKYKIPLVVTGEDMVSREYNIFLDEPLRKIRDHSDYIDFKTGKVVRKIGYKAYVGDSEYFYKNDEGTPEWFIQTTTALENCVRTIDSNDALCNYFENKVIYSNTTDVGFQIRWKMTTFRFPTEISLSEFKRFLQTKNAEGNPLIVYYIYETPVEEIIDLPVIESTPNSNVVEADTKIQPHNIKIQYYKKG